MRFFSIRRTIAAPAVVGMALLIGGSAFAQEDDPFGGLEANEVTKLRHMEDENNRLKKPVAELALDKEMLKSLLIKNGLSS